MRKGDQSIALCMIVKNEHHVLRRCLESVRPLIDTWCIVDTGSTDGTQDLVRDYFADLPGQLVERPWKNFGHNRSEALTLARPSADYVLTLDADEYLQTDPGFSWPHLTGDAYDFTVVSGDVTYARTQLMRSALPWRYEGVLHEYIACDRPYSRSSLSQVRTVRLLEGARSRDPLTYRRDAQLLEQALLEEPRNARYMFYLAQSYRDAGEPKLAIDRYLKRARMGGFAEEVWSSLYEAAKLMDTIGMPWPVVMNAYMTAHACRSSRAEPLFRIGMHFQQRREFAQAKEFFGRALEIPLPSTDLLFVEADVYRFLLPLEYAVACYWLGQHHEAITVTDRLLEGDNLTPERRGHLLKNRQFSVDALRAPRT